MNLYVRNNKFWFELENLTRLFFPNEKINVFKDDTPLELPYICAEQGECITVSVRIGDFAAEKTAPVSADDNSNELSMVKLLYVILRDFSGVDQPWGLLTGVRPIKLLRRVREELGEAAVERRFLDDYYVSPEKLSLAMMTEEHEQRIIGLSRPESFSLYVGVPFCPTRCSYCSFVMSSVERAKKLIQPYADFRRRHSDHPQRRAARQGARYGEFVL